MNEDWNRYGPTAARPAGAKPGRMVRPQSVTIDIHSHIAIPRASDFVKPHLDLASIPLAHFASPETKTINIRQDHERRPVMTSYDQRLADLDDMGIDRQLVMPPPPQCYYTVPVDIAVEAARMINDGVAEFVAGKPDRFAALGTVPMPDAAAAASELERCIKTLGFKGCGSCTNVAGKELSDPAFAPFWAKAEALGARGADPSQWLHRGAASVAVLFQQRRRQSAGDDDRPALPHFRRRARAPSEPQDHRRARRRLSRRLFRPHRPRLGRARRCPRRRFPSRRSSYLKKIYVDTVVFTPGQLAALVETFGADHVLMGTDYPYDMAEYDPLEHLAATKSLDATAVAAIAGGNARKLLGM